MNFIDILILVLIIFAGINGFRKGIINSLAIFIGTLLIFVLAFYLKNPISTILYEHFPFFDLGGKFEGVTVFNILIYEGISYLLTISILAFILKLLTKVSKVLNNVIHSTLILGFPSKILGFLIGLLQGYIIAFIIIFSLSLISSTASKVNESEYGNKLLETTPILSQVVSSTYNSITEVYAITTKFENAENKEQANLESLDVLLKYEILTVESADKLIETKKIDIPDAKTIIDKYRKTI